MKILHKLKWLYVLGLFIFFLVNCNPLGIFGIGSSSEISSLIPIDGLNTAHIPNESFFYININNSYYVGEDFDQMQAFIYAMDFGPGTDCKIKKPENSEEGNTEDLYCIMDIMEGDLWFHTIVLEYNVPPEMCDYLGVDVPWHFNQQVGEGPDVVHQCNVTLCSGSGDDSQTETETRYCLGPCTRGDPPGDCSDEEVVTGCGGAYVTEDPNQFCGILDKSDNDLANCCLGDYELHNDDNINEVDWGGDLRNCIGGLGRISWNTFNDDGLPIKEITNVKSSGLNRDYEIPALVDIYEGHKRRGVSSMRQPTFITANYWTDAEEKDSATTKPDFYNPPTTSDLPDNVTPVPSNWAGHPYLTLSCMNKAYEKKHRIHLLIREWNTQAEFNKFANSKGSRGDSDIDGLEGSFCEYYEADEGNILPQDTDCNDSYDADDWDANYGSHPYPEIIYNN